ncbi:MAG TPA: bacteriohemerythrin [Acidobacteriaceae bacterium]|jgi:hemerythrin|nr:bacteriohemerythrin [Acidobacteriaceae bacterium]
MATFAWSDAYSVKVQQFDAQHQKLFEIINSLADAMRAGQGEDVIREVVGQLAVYTRTHFLQEEVAMRQAGYPDLPAHQAQHSKLMAEVEKHKKELDEGRKPNLVAVLNFLRDWLVQHIQKSDKKYSDHLNAHGMR